MWFAFFGLFACQEPFGRDRHDLVGSRLAAVVADNDGEVVRPALALVVDGKPWSDTAPEIDWYWIESEGDAAELVPGSFGIGRGPAPEIEADGERLAVLVTLSDGTVLRGEVEVAVPRGHVSPRLASAVVPSLSLDTVEGSDLALEARRAIDAAPGRSVEPGGFARFTLEGADTESLSRFMATGGGTFFELDFQTADWVAGDLRVDDEEIELREPIGEGPITVMGLEIGAHRSGFSVADFFVGDIPSGVWTQGRFLATDTPLDGRFWAVLVKDDASPTGLGLDAAFPADPDDTFDPSGLCGPLARLSGDRFDPDWLIEQRCTRADLEGELVLVEADGVDP